jgi:hypothetical protein
VVFVETKAFTRRLQALAGDRQDEVLHRIQQELLENPERGAAPVALGGVRKARVSNPGRGKENGEACGTSTFISNIASESTFCICWTRTNRKI